MRRNSITAFMAAGLVAVSLSAAPVSIAPARKGSLVPVVRVSSVCALMLCDDPPPAGPYCDTGCEPGLPWQACIHPFLFEAAQNYYCAEPEMGCETE